MKMNKAQAKALAKLIEHFGAIEFDLILRLHTPHDLGQGLVFKTEDSVFRCTIQEDGTVANKEEVRTHHDWSI